MRVCATGRMSTPWLGILSLDGCCDTDIGQTQCSVGGASTGWDLGFSAFNETHFLASRTDCDARMIMALSDVPSKQSGGQVFGSMSMMGFENEDMSFEMSGNITSIQVGSL